MIQDVRHGLLSRQSPFVLPGNCSMYRHGLTWELGTLKDPYPRISLIRAML